MALPVRPVVWGGERLVEGRGAGDPARRTRESAPPAARLPAPRTPVHPWGQKKGSRQWKWGVGGRCRARFVGLLETEYRARLPASHRLPTAAPCTS